MATAFITYALPTVQLVCHLTATGNSTTGITIPRTMDPRFPAQASPRALPPGYVPHPHIGVAYKVHDEEVTWYVANARCAQEGGYLGNIDTFAKIELVKQQQPAANNNVHVGFHLIDGDSSTWYSVKTGLPIANIPWQSGEPYGSGHCARMISSYVGLGQYSCTGLRYYVCEIPYP